MITVYMLQEVVYIKCLILICLMSEYFQLWSELLTLLTWSYFFICLDVRAYWF